MSTVNFLLFANPNHIICCGSISPKECSRLTLLFWGWNMNNMHTIPDQKITVDQNKEFLHHIITTYRKLVINTYQLQNQAKDQFDNQNEDSIQYSLLKDYPMAKLLAFHSFCLDLEELYVIYCVEQPRCINQYYNTMQPTKLQYIAQLLVLTVLGRAKLGNKTHICVCACVMFILFFSCCIKVTITIKPEVVYLTYNLA